ncbi:MAG TPA: single-stranded-DNA-specific exonuclease RecJ [Solirubrobacterales bacterium]|nr:single-stranded-DNA-specific exonuclease RecJ [Solirubrobacterales bacterium]
MAKDPIQLRADPYDYREARTLADALGLSEPLAIALVRRGWRDVEAARAFLAAEEAHPPDGFGSMAQVVALAREAIEAGRRITVHGDFDVDGVCATAILVRALRQLGADCDWLIPDRLVDGYGVSAENVEMLAARGTRLLITVDCGITAVEEVALARSLGIDVIVTDHHQAGEELPDCPILHPSLDGYPFPDLCGTAVAWKLACALRQGPGTPPPETVAQQIGGKGSGVVSGASVGGVPGPCLADLDLVALATVADVVPLVGENRNLVKRGLEELRRARRPGMKALLEVAKCEPGGLDESDLGFRLAPRINAAGRLYRADAGVELFLTDDEKRAEEIAKELNRANAERRATERQVEAAAEAAHLELPDALRDAPAIVVAGEGWHPGVVGIVASRLSERHHRPTVVVSLDAEGGGRGSGRSIPGFDLLAGLRACSDHLARFGGHRAAAGLELEAGKLGDFREAFAAHATALLSPDDLVRTERVDAIVGGAELGLELAEELECLRPFGMGNPGLRLLVPAAKVRAPRPMGEGKHLRFDLHSGGRRALGVAFGRSSIGVGEDEVVDAAVRLEVNRWNGSVEPRVLLRELRSAPAPCNCPGPEWWDRFERELRLPLGQAPGPGGAALPPGRETVRRHGGPAATIAELVSSGAEVLAICADAKRRAGIAALARLCPGQGPEECEECGGPIVEGLRTPAVIDYIALERTPELVREFTHVVLADPPPTPRHAALAGSPVDGWTESGGQPGYLHEAWVESDVATTLAALEAQLARRPALIAAYRDLREAGEASGELLQQALRGGDPYPRDPEAAARCFRVLEELGLVRGAPEGGNGTVGVVSSEGTDLERSAAFRAYGALHEEALRYLERPNKT